MHIYVHCELFSLCFGYVMFLIEHLFTHSTPSVSPFLLPPLPNFPHPHRHWWYQLLMAEHVNGELQKVAPDQPEPPHCP